MSDGVTGLSPSVLSPILDALSPDPTEAPPPETDDVVEAYSFNTGTWASLRSVRLSQSRSCDLTLPLVTMTKPYLYCRPDGAYDDIVCFSGTQSCCQVYAYALRQHQLRNTTHIAVTDSAQLPASVAQVCWSAK